MHREKVRSMFQHGYNSYMQHAYPRDELCPLSCSGRDTWGKFSLTLIDSLDTLAVGAAMPPPHTHTQPHDLNTHTAIKCLCVCMQVMGNMSEFQRAYNLVISNPSFDINVNVSVFETNIRGECSCSVHTSHCLTSTCPPPLLFP